jgi:hypothetical protein
VRLGGGRRIEGGGSSEGGEGWIEVGMDERHRDGYDVFVFVCPGL